MCAPAIARESDSQPIAGSGHASNAALLYSPVLHLSSRISGRRTCDAQRFTTIRRAARRLTPSRNLHWRTPTRGLDDCTSKKGRKPISHRWHRAPHARGRERDARHRGRLRGGKGTRERRLDHRMREETARHAMTNERAIANFSATFLTPRATMPQLEGILRSRRGAAVEAARRWAVRERSTRTPTTVRLRGSYAGATTRRPFRRTHRGAAEVQSLQGSK